MYEMRLQYYDEASGEHSGEFVLCYSKDEWERFERSWLKWIESTLEEIKKEEGEKKKTKKTSKKTSQERSARTLSASLRSGWRKPARARPRRYVQPRERGASK